ncbi:hypothetical protein O0L34_g1427 [Tuta absoluta]|nr:hypothetical protein O0L34_g1427 [Tuta absoluta]
MAQVYRIFSMNCLNIRHITKPVKWGIARHYSVKILASGICYNSDNTINRCVRNDIGIYSKSIRQCSSKSVNPDSPEKEPPKLGLMKRLKVMYRDYWYVTVPVHMMTSAIWFGGLYYIVSSGVDMLAVVESFGISEKLTAPLKESGAGNFAVSLALYKLISPLRYAVTIGGTTFAIKQLEGLGWIKPVPSKERLKEMYQEKKDNFQDRKAQYQVQMKEKRSHLMDEMRRYKHDMKKRVKKM